MSDKPARLQKIEDHYAHTSMHVEFDDGFGGEWMVHINGHFADFEVKAIADALEEANKPCS